MAELGCSNGVLLKTIASTEINDVWAVDNGSAGNISFPIWRSVSHAISRYLKIAIDVSVAVVLLIVLLPLFIVIGALVALDGGPIFYGHPRLGARGRSFKCMKFRSMVVDSNAVLQQLLKTDPAAAAEWAATHKLRRDPRITKVGAFLRATSLDELPQLINVLRLDMSLVGPRPIVQAEVVKYGDYIDYYYKTRPGITGLWQISGRSETTYNERVALDVSYVKNWDLLSDIKILLRTVPAVLNRSGAF